MTRYRDDQRYGKGGLAAGSRSRLCLRKVHPVGDYLKERPLVGALNDVGLEQIPWSEV
jgi:hypothetical protein